MSEAPEKLWSDHPYAPRIQPTQYQPEKNNFTGTLIGTVLYGFITILFFRCVGALYNPANHPGAGINWWLMAHTVTIFTAFTMFTVTSLAMLSICYIDDREFSNVDTTFTGPWGYLVDIIYWKAINLIPNTMLLLNNWFADGILLYRCYVIYAMNPWVIVFPCMMYLASIGMGVAFIYVQPNSNHPKTFITVHDFGISWFSISLSLNVLLTIMIIARLILHNRDLRKALGIPVGTVGIYKTVVTMLVESFALYAGVSLLYITTWGPHNHAAYVIWPILAASQVIAPFLIILRVANRRALTNRTTVSGGIGSMRFWGEEESTVGGEPLVDGDHPSTTDSTVNGGETLPHGNT